MFCAVKAIDREGGTRSVVFNTQLTFSLGKFRSLRPFWFTAGQVVPPIHNTRSWLTFTELCCLVCEQYFASKALQRRYPLF